ncbi:octanoyl-[acyl-carrier-protein]:protein N-octanoyltransferase LIPT2, mitochondrial-like [Littorina saxatilis]|uniref:lipoyl(octanoyl) transferase n=1 Tax=Littorina saxatilis TaxID=31220 RepID=A0AAN9G111_9CAEN
MASQRVVNVINLGRMGFLKAFDVQLRYANLHLDGLAGVGHAVGRNTLLLVEHNPVYTIGLRTKDYDELEEIRLKKLGAEFYRTNRGGLITYHGPGQLVAYPVLNLRHFQPSMRWYISKLESTVINTCHRFNIDARTSEHTGVWVGDRKIAAIGVHGSRYITTHGISLNCDTDLTWFRHIVPCDIMGKDVTSVSQVLKKPTPIKKVITPFLSAFEEEFDCEIEYSMFDSEDNTWLREGAEEDGDEEGAESQAGVSANSSSHAPLQAVQQGVRLMSTAASSKSSQPPTMPRIAMW